MKADKFEQFLKNVKDHNDIFGRDKQRSFGVLVSLVKLEGTYYFLLQKRAENIRQGSEICFPGGRYDPALDKNFEDTAVRETVEEIGVAREKIEVISKIDTTVFPVYIENYLGIVHIDSLDDLNINKDEVDRVFVMPVDYFIENEPERYAIKVRSYSSELVDGQLIEYFPVKDLDLPERYHNSWNERFREVYVYRTPHGTLWGITAQIIYETVEKYLKD